MAFVYKRGNTYGGVALLLLCFFILLSLAVAAHEEEETLIPQQEGQATFWKGAGFEESLQTFNLRFLAVVTALVIVLIVIAMNHGKETQRFKKAIFLAIVIPIIGATLFLIGSTLYLNITSLTKGPVHWHADYEVWYCGQKLDLTAPHGLSNRIGSSTLHEHNDDRIHIEGVVRHFDDVTLQAYFKTIGGDLVGDGYLYPTDHGVVSARTGEQCPDGEIGLLKVYVNGKKELHAEHYVITPTSYVPPGDCIIFDFGPGDAETTDTLCETWSAQGWTYENQDVMRQREGGSG